MRIRSILGKIPWLHGITKGNYWSQSRESEGHPRDVITKDGQGGTDKCLPSFKTLKQVFVWTDECEVAFQEQKHYLSNLPLLSPSKEGKDMFPYLVVSTTIVSATLIREERRVQRLVYYVSQAFQGAEAKYPHMEKITFAMIVASWKLHPYFQANPIIVMTN